MTNVIQPDSAKLQEIFKSWFKIADLSVDITEDMVDRGFEKYREIVNPHQGLEFSRYIVKSILEAALSGHSKDKNS